MELRSLTLGILTLGLLNLHCGGVEGESHLDVYGGQMISDQVFPSTTKLRNCTANFIGKSVALTAAHCVVKVDGKKFSPPEIWYKSRWHQVNRVIVNPFFKGSKNGTIATQNIQHDLAILLLDFEVDDFVEPCTTKPPPSQIVQIVGYGFTDFRSTMGSFAKRFGNNRIFWQGKGRIEVKASSDESLADNANIGSGDSGGGIYWDGCLLGINSAISISETRSLGFFVDLTSLLSKAFVAFGRNGERLQVATLQNRTGATVFIQGGDLHSDETRLGAWRSMPVPLGARLRLRDGKTCYPCSPTEEKEYQARLRSRFFNDCKPGWRSGCLDVAGDLEKPVPHRQGCDDFGATSDGGYYRRPKVSFQEASGGFITSEPNGLLSIENVDKNSAGRFEVLKNSGTPAIEFNLTQDHLGYWGRTSQDLTLQSTLSSADRYKLINRTEGYGIAEVVSGRLLGVNHSGFLSVNGKKGHSSVFLVDFH